MVGFLLILVTISMATFLIADFLLSLSRKRFDG